jgi:Fe-S cluster biogenesis protein NfuA
MSPPEARELVADVERLLEQVDGIADDTARGTATELVSALVELYGAGLERIVDVIAARDDGEMAAAFADDELVSHLLLIHGLHPVPLQARVTGALASVRPYLESHGGDVELLAVQEPTVRLRLEGSCSGCPSSTMTLKLAIENAIRKAAPEIEEVIADGAVPSSPSLLQIEMMPSAPGPCLKP